jgi:HK97 family phage major capsid protein/HK97 family phage prohead protease
MDRAFGVLQFRAIDDDARIIEGVASTDLLDDYDTVLVPKGAKFDLPLPLLWQHEKESPVGHVISADVTSSRIKIRAQLAKISEPGPLKDVVDRAWQAVKHGLVRGLSVGFLPVKGGTKGNTFNEWMWKELSLVTLPANSQATISNIRSLAASGERRTPSPGVPGTQPNPRHGNMTIQEQITQHENTRAAKVAQRDALLEKSAAEGRTLDQSESETFDTLDEEVRSIDGHLVRLASAKKDAEKRAVPVDGTTPARAGQTRAGVAVSVKSRELPPGIGFARHCMALAVSQGNKYEAAEYAKRTWGDQADEIVVGIREGMQGLQTRAAVAPGTTVQATFAAPLVITNYITDFLELLRPEILIGKIQGMRHVPFNVSMPAQTAGGTYKWVGQGKLKPVTNAQYASVTLAFAKASGIIVLTEELVRMSTPSAEAAVRDELVKGITAFLDVQFVDSTVAAVANVNPASITNGVTGTAASAATMAAARTDIAARIAAFATATYPLSELVILMSESQAFSLGLGLNAVGQPLFPGLTVSGGSLLGVPVVTSQAVGNQIIIAHAPSILIADESGVEVDISREASVYLDSAPTDPPDATAVLTSLWQANLVGLRVERYITWGKARSTAVDRITSVAYAP